MHSANIKYWLDSSKAKSSLMVKVWVWMPTVAWIKGIEDENVDVDIDTDGYANIQKRADVELNGQIETDRSLQVSEAIETTAAFFTAIGIVRASSKAIKADRAMVCRCNCKENKVN